MKRTNRDYQENPYLVLFDAAEELGVFDFFERKSEAEQEKFFPVDEIYSGCRSIPPVYKGVDCPREKKCPFRDRETDKVPCEDFYNKNYPPIRCPFNESSKQTFYFLLTCLTSELEFFEKKGRYFRKKYEGSAGQSTAYKMLESGVYNHIFDLKKFLDFSNAYESFIEFKDELIINPHRNINRKAHSDELFLDKIAISTYLSGVAKMACEQLPEFLSVTDFSECRSILDIGSGPCIYSRGIFEKLRSRNPQKANSRDIKIFGLDFNTVKGWYRSADYRNLLEELPGALGSTEFEKHFTFISIIPGHKPGENEKDALFSDETWNQDMLKKRQFDAILIQNVLSHNSKRNAKRLIEKCYNKLNFGGKIKIQDYFKELSESQPFTAVVCAVYFRSISYTGQTFTNFELSHMLFECGFRNIKRLKISYYSSIIEAEKTFPTTKDDILNRFWRYMFIRYSLNRKRNQDKNGLPCERQPAVRFAGEMLNYDSLYSINFISLFKKAILEYKRDIAEVKDRKAGEKPVEKKGRLFNYLPWKSRELANKRNDRCRAREKNYIKIFLEEGDFAAFLEGDRFENLIEYIGGEISSSIKKIKDCFQENLDKLINTGENKRDETMNDPESDAIKNCWKLLFYLEVLDKDVVTTYDHDSNALKIKDDIFAASQGFLLHLIKSKRCPDHLTIFFLLVLLREFPGSPLEEIIGDVEYIANLEEPHFVVKQLQKYFGPDREECKFNLLNCLVEADKINAPSAFIYLWTLRWFLKYEFLNRDEFEYPLLVEEFSESRYEFVMQEVIKLRKVLDMQNGVCSQARGR